MKPVHLSESSQDAGHMMLKVLSCLKLYCALYNGLYIVRLFKTILVYL